MHGEVGRCNIARPTAACGGPLSNSYNLQRAQGAPCIADVALMESNARLECLDLLDLVVQQCHM